MLLGVLVWLLSMPVLGQSLFDVHLHYKSGDADALGDERVLQILQRNDIERAVIIGQPPELAQRLYRRAPQRIVPFLGVYRGSDDKLQWMHDEGLPRRVEKMLQQGQWFGLGELHLFAADRHSPVFRRLVELAGEYGLVMMIHGDPAVIDTLYELAPGQPVIWAHAGAYPYPPLLNDYLERYPALMLDLSVRNGRIAPQGEPLDSWYRLIMTYPERIMLGVDTFSLNRWRHYGKVAGATRRWLQQLPEEVAAALAYGNARRLFAAPGRLAIPSEAEQNGIEGAPSK